VVDGGHLLLVVALAGVCGSVLLDAGDTRRPISAIASVT